MTLWIVIQFNNNNDWESKELVAVASSDGGDSNHIMEGGGLWGSQHPKSPRNHNNKIGLAHDETRHVNCVRMIVVMVLIVATLGMALAIHYYIQYSEQKNFTKMFYSDANRILQGIGESMKSNLAAMDTFASMWVSVAKHTNQIFPFVTLPTFAIKASKLLTQSDGFFLPPNPSFPPKIGSNGNNVLWKTRVGLMKQNVFKALMHSFMII
jgi:hypothetical protein